MAYGMFTTVIKRLMLLGIDRAIAYTLVGRVWQIITGVLTLLFLVKFLSPAEIGFYYTFGSILAFQSIFDFGFSYVILQFAAHEKAKLSWHGQYILDGDPIAKSRLAAIMRLGISFYGIISLIAPIIIIPVGLYFFCSHTALDTSVSWRVPWIWLALSTSANFAMIPLFCILEGTGRVAEVSLIRLSQGILSSLSLWLSLVFKFDLFSQPIASTTTVVCGVLWMGLLQKQLFLDLWRNKIPEGIIKWKEEMWPFQRRNAVTNLCGYFFANLINPLIFSFSGPVAAGKLGMTNSIVNAIGNMGVAWVSTKSAPFGTLVAQRAYRDLDNMFFRALWQSLSLIILGSAFILIVLYFLQGVQHPFASRVLSPTLCAVLLSSMILTHVVVSEAIYLRSHKREPFMWLTLIGTPIMATSQYFSAKYWGVSGVVITYLLTYFLVSFIPATTLFLRKRRLWHNVEKTPEK